MTRDEWQAFFDHRFPDGAIVTVVQTDETSAKYDDSPQYLTEGFRVTDVESEDHPEVSFFIFTTPREIRFSVEAVEERDYGLFLTTTEADAPSFMFSHRLSDPQRQMIASERASEEEEL